jgi:Cys-tRNA(Pro)/Cys-tRNA(Cys) deacylase
MATKKGATPAIAELERLGISYGVHEYAHDPSATSFGDEAAEALGGVVPDRVFKTLVATVGGELVVAIVPVPATLDLKALAAALGAKRAEMADPAAAERSSGYVVGAISPLGQKRRLRTVIDESALAFETVFCSGGRRGLEIEMAPADLVRAAGAEVAAVARS